jgi:hypothetical protein
MLLPALQQPASEARDLHSAPDGIVISGRVTERGSGQSLPRIVVTLTRISSSSPQLTVTDDDGRYEFRGSCSTIQPVLTARGDRPARDTRRGRQAHPRRAARESASETVIAMFLVGLVLVALLQTTPPLTQEPARSSEIRGRVTDREAGQPLPRARVILVRMGAVSAGPCAPTIRGNTGLPDYPPASTQGSPIQVRRARRTRGGLSRRAWAARWS